MRLLSEKSFVRLESSGSKDATIWPQAYLVLSMVPFDTFLRSQWPLNKLRERIVKKITFSLKTNKPRSKRDESNKRVRMDLRRVFDT